MARVNKMAERRTVQLGGRERTLRFDIEALRLIREEMQLDLLNNAQAFNENLTLEQIATFIWAALTHDDDELYADGEPGPARVKAIRRVSRMLDFDNLQEVMQAMFAAFGAAMPEAKDGDTEGEPDPNGNGPS